MRILCKIRYRQCIQIHIRICVFDTVDQCMVHGAHLGEVCTHNSQSLHMAMSDLAVSRPMVVRSYRINIWD